MMCAANHHVHITVFVFKSHNRLAIVADAMAPDFGGIDANESVHLKWIRIKVISSHTNASLFDERYYFCGTDMQSICTCVFSFFFKLFII